MSKRAYQVGQYWLEENRSGKWAVCWYDPQTRQRRSKSTGTKDFQLACQQVDELHFQRSVPQGQDPGSVFIAKIFHLFWEGRAKDLPSADCFKSSFRLFLEFLDTQKAAGWIQTDGVVSDLTIALQERFISWAAVKPVVWKRKDGTVTKTAERSNQSINRNLADIRAALNWCQLRDHVTMVPKIIAIEKNQLTNKRKARIPATDMARIFDYLAKTEKWHIHAYMLASCCTIARPTEVLDLSVDPARQQIDWDAGLIHLNPVGRIQTKKHRATIPMSETMRTLLIWAQINNKSTFLVDYNGKRVASIKKAWGTIRDHLGLPKNWVAKNTRHTMATWCRSQQVNAWDLAGHMGHRRLTTTEEYAVFDPTYLHTVTDACDAFLLEVQSHMKTDLLSHYRLKETSNVKQLHQL